MKNKILVFIALIACLLSIGCQNPMSGSETGDASFTITINGGSGRAVDYLTWDNGTRVADLVHTITLTNASGDNLPPRENLKSGDTVKFSVAPGHWVITVKAFLGDVLKAEGSTPVYLKPGRNPAVTVNMGPPSSTSAYPITMQTDDHGAAEAEPESAAAGAKVSIQAVPENGYMFDYWEIVNGDVTFEFNENPVEFIMPQSAVTIKAHFKTVPLETPVLNFFPVTFIPVTVGYSQLETHTVTIHNTGTAEARVSSIALSGTNSNSFILDRNLPQTIAAKASAGFTVQPNVGLVAGTYTATITATYSGGIVQDAKASTNISFTVNAHVTAVTPHISEEPQSAVYSQGATAIPLIVTALSLDDGELFYKWYKNSTNSTVDWVLVESGNDKSSYTPSTITVGDFYYWCVVTNIISDNGDGGTKTASATSSVAIITVNTKVNAARPLITNPQSVVIVSGETATLSVIASVTDRGEITFQWYRSNSNNNTSGTPVTDGTDYNTAIYTTPTTLAVGTYYYYCVVTNTIEDNGDGGTKSVASVSAPATVKVYGVGSGTEPDPYIVYNVPTLERVGKGEGEWADWSLSAYYLQIRDITLPDPTNGSRNWTPIGYIVYDVSWNIIENHSFTGSYDGNGHKISNLKINSPNDFTQGLFGYISGAMVKNVGIENCDIICGNSGGVAGWIENSTVQYCYVTGNISGAWVGGVAGISENGTVQYCYTTCNVSGDEYVGGVVGENYGGTVENCYSTGNISGTNEDGVGGVVGISEYENGFTTKVKNCYAQRALFHLIPVQADLKSAE